MAPPLLRMGLSPRASGLSRSEAQLYWRTTHAGFFRKVPGLLSYAQNHAVLDEGGMPLLGEPGFDIFSEVAFSTHEDLEAAVASDYYQSVVLPDERMLLDARDRSFLLAHWQPAASPATPRGCKLVAILAAPAADLAGLGADRTYRIEAGSGPIGARAGLVLHWFCADSEAALQRQRRNMTLDAFAQALIAATIVRPNVVVDAPAAKAGRP